jgi:hypothetical protein
MTLTTTNQRAGSGNYQERLHRAGSFHLQSGV